jgi:dTDP-4-dehydrorhamnose reductase
MNILVFGKDGQLGKAFQEFSRKNSLFQSHVVKFVGRGDCDLSHADQITNLLNNFQPNLIINAAAYTAVDKAETAANVAFAINADAPELMAKYAAQHGSTFLHFSTDYVFDGVKQGSYLESDQTNPLSIYGESKEAGEKAIVEAFDSASSKNGRYAILRTSWVYGDGNNFIRTILRLAKSHSSLRVINDQYGVPTSADWLAEVGSHLALSDSCLRDFRSGIYHATPSGVTNWYGLACLVTKLALDADQELLVSPAEITPIPASEYPLPAQRPMNSQLSSGKLKIELERLGLVSKLPHWNTSWDEQVSRYVKDLLKD